MQQTLETERFKWEKERERMYKEQKKDRQLYNTSKNLWETERTKREKALLDLMEYVESFKKNPQPPETVEALKKLYDDLIVSMQRLN